MFDKNTYFIREHVGLLKLSDTYDIIDPETQEQIGVAKEKPGGLMILLRFFVNKQMLPTKVHVYEGNDPQNESALSFTIKRGFTFLRARIDVVTAKGQLIGWFKRKLLSLGGAFLVFDAKGNQVAMVKGDWKGWNFQFLDNQQNEFDGEPEPGRMTLLLAAGLAIDVVFKEKN